MAVPVAPPGARLHTLDSAIQSVDVSFLHRLHMRVAEAPGLLLLGSRKRITSRQFNKHLAATTVLVIRARSFPARHFEPDFQKEFFQIWGTCVEKTDLTKEPVPKE